jgi:hypothetical protein
LNLFPEGKERGRDHLEVLTAERNSDDGDAEDQATDDMDQSDLPPSCKDPDYVHYDRKATGLLRSVDQFVAERPEGIGPDLKQLNPERNSDYSQTHKKSDDVIDNSDDKASEKEPYDIS